MRKYRANKGEREIKDQKQREKKRNKITQLSEEEKLLVRREKKERCNEEISIDNFASRVRKHREKPKINFEFNHSTINKARKLSKLLFTDFYLTLCIFAK